MAILNSTVVNGQLDAQELNVLAGSGSQALYASGNVTVDGNLEVKGDLVYVGTKDLQVEDKLIEIAYNSASATTSAQADGAGIVIGNESNPVASIKYRHADENIVFDKHIDGTVKQADDATHADAAAKVDNSLTIKLSNEESYSFDGSADVNVDISSIVSDAHTHSNKAVLDGISAEKVSAWDSAEQHAKEYADGLKNTIDAYTVNSKAISSNPVLGSEDIMRSNNQSVEAAIADLEAAIGESGSVSEQIAAAINDLDASITASGSHVTVQVVETDGKISAVSVTESNIAKASELDLVEQSLEETGTVGSKIKANADAIDVLNGSSEVEGSVAKAVADSLDSAKSYADGLKTAIEGELSEQDAKTLAALNDRIDGVESNAKSYNMVALTADEIAALSDGANVKEAFKLMQTVGESSQQAGETIKVYKDSSLKSVELADQQLVFTYILADGQESVVSVDVSAFLAESEFADGLQVVDHVVSVKVAEDSENYLSVSSNGLKVSGINNFVSTSVSDSLDSAKQYADNLNASMSVRVQTIESDYLKAADKTQLSESIASSNVRIAGLESKSGSWDNAKSEAIAAASTSLAEYSGSQALVNSSLSEAVEAVSSSLNSYSSSQAIVNNNILESASAYASGAQAAAIEHANGLNESMSIRVATLETSSADHESRIDALENVTGSYMLADGSNSNITSPLSFNSGNGQIKFENGEFLFVFNN